MPIRAIGMADGIIGAKKRHEISRFKISDTMSSRSASPFSKVAFASRYNRFGSYLRFSAMIAKK